MTLCLKLLLAGAQGRCGVLQTRVSVPEVLYRRAPKVISILPSAIIVWVPTSTNSKLPIKYAILALLELPQSRQCAPVINS